MIRRLLLVSLFCAGYALGQNAIPNTPAGQVLTAWLEAFNSADRAKLQEYLKTFEPKRASELVTSTSFRNQTGGFDLLSIESSQPLAISFKVKERAGETVALGRIELNSAQPPIVENFGLRAIPPGAVIDDIKLTALIRQRVIDDIGVKLKEFYVYPDAAERMKEAINTNLKNGEYDAITSGEAFASLLTTHLQAVSHDKHLRVMYNPYKVSGSESAPTPEQAAERRKQMERDCGFRKLEILPGNIGYLKFDFFADPDVCGPTAVAAMNFLAHVDAIIFDLRENGGGDPKMIALISTYLFDKSVHLNDLYDRKQDATTQFWTLPFVPGSRLPTAAAFVLTSKDTFSGAEEFSNNLKELKRATIVGETTGGGAHPVSGHIIADHFMIAVPFARAINPISKQNWEGTGVAPDVAVSAADALETAEKLAAAWHDKK